MPVLSLGESALRSLVRILRCAADFLISLLQQLGQRQVDMRSDSIDFLLAISAYIRKEAIECVLVQPILDSLFRNRSVRTSTVYRSKIVEQRRLGQAMLTSIERLNCEQAFVYDLCKAVHRARAIEVNPRGRFVLKGP